MLCAVAPYRPLRVSPIAEMRAAIGLHEEFAFEAVIDEINEQKMANKKLMLLLNSLGGGLHSSFKVARALRQSFSKNEIEVYVPHIALKICSKLNPPGDFCGSRSPGTLAVHGSPYESSAPWALTLRNAQRTIRLWSSLRVSAGTREQPLRLP